jgi:hypothetical protein
VPPDLRKTDCRTVIARVEQTLGTRFDLATEVCKRRSIGLRTDRKTWVRIEIRDLSRSDGQGWGVEATAMLHGVSLPAWHQGISWIDHDLGVMWRADETELVADPSIKSGGILTVELELSDQWWATFNSSMDALAKQTTARIATPGLRPITQARVTETIHQFFDGVDTTVDEWTAAHADLAWPNLTAPNCYLLDWEDWGMAPRGFDAALLWSESLAVPALAARVYEERRTDLDSRSGTLCRLYCCAKLIAGGNHSGALLAPAISSADNLFTALRR